MGSSGTSTNGGSPETQRAMERNLYGQLKPVVALSYDLPMGFTPIRFVAEYPTHGFGITRLTLVCDDWFPFESFAEASSIDAANADSASIDSWNQPSLERVDSLRSSFGLSESEESSDSDEAFSRLPRWIKVLNEIRRKARRASSE